MILTPCGHAVIRVYDEAGNVIETHEQAGCARGGGSVALLLTIVLLLPLACIWFPRRLGDYAGTICGQLVTSSTPHFWLARPRRRASHRLCIVCCHVNGPNPSLQLTAGRRDDQFEFMRHILDVAKARSRQRWLSSFSLGRTFELICVEFGLAT